MFSPLSEQEWTIVLLSLKVSFCAMLAALPLAFALAWVLARMRFRGQVWLDGLIHLPLVLPPVVTGWLLLLALAPQAPLGAFLERYFGLTFVFHWTGAALASAVMALPLMVRAMRLALESVDPRLEETARTLGASRWRCFCTITLPLSAHGMAAALVLGFARSLGEFGATITFAANIAGETQTLPLAIYSALQMPQSDGQVARLAMLSIALSLGALVLSETLIRRSGREKGRYGL